MVFSNSKNKSTHFRTWKSGKSWLVSSALVAAVVSTGAVAADASADTTLTPVGSQVTISQLSAVSLAPSSVAATSTVAVSAAPRSVSTTQGGMSLAAPSAPSASSSSSKGMSFAFSSVATSSVVTSSVVTSSTATSSTTDLGAFLQSIAPALSAAAYSAKVSGDTSEAAGISNIQELVNQLSSAEATSPSAASAYTASLTSALSSYAKTSAYATANSSFTAIANSGSKEFTSALGITTSSEASAFGSSLTSLVSAVSDFAVASSAGLEATESLVASNLSSMAQTASGKAEILSLASSLTSLMNNSSLATTIASMGESYAAQSAGSDAQAVASVMALWQKEAVNPTSANVAALTAAKAGLTDAQNSLASQIMTEVSQNLPSSVSQTLASISLADATVEAPTTQSTTVTFWNALVLSLAPTLASITVGVIGGELLAFVAQTVLGISADILAGVTLSVPMMMPVVSWFFTAINAIGTGAATGIVGGVGFGIGGGVLLAIVTGFASGSLFNNTTVAGNWLGIDQTNPANVQTENAINLGAGIGTALGGAIGAMAGGTIGAGITNIVSGAAGLGLGALATIPFVGAITSPIEDVITTVMVILGDQIGGGIGAVIGGIPVGVIGGMVGYLAQVTGILPSFYEFIGSILNSVLDNTVINNTQKTGSIVTQDVPVPTGTTPNLNAGFVSAVDAGGNPVPLSSITREGLVNTTVPGSYIIVYSFIDPVNGQKVVGVSNYIVSGATTAAAMTLKTTSTPAPAIALSQLALA